MTIDADRYTGRTDAGLALRATLMRLLDRHQNQPGTAENGTTIHRVGELGGFRIEAEISRHPQMGSYGDLRIENLPVRRYPLDRADLAKADPVGLVSKLEHRIFDLDETVLTLRAQAEQARSEAADAAARLGRPFEHRDRLQMLRARLVEIDQALAPETETPVPAASPDAALAVVFPQTRPASIEA
jgi:hypothetical protein